ncbi:MAG: hypothetical protein ACJAYN_000136 [Bermanella sp.]|jgi:hypothetical protein|nr:hypothetical protein CXF81_04950 [Glaciecola sp. 33A]
MLTASLIYLLIGIMFAIVFFVIGYRKIDPSAAGTPWFVRLLWTPAALAIWPILIIKWLRPRAFKPN